MLNKYNFSYVQTPSGVFIMLINVKIPIFTDILNLWAWQISHTVVFSMKQILGPDFPVYLKGASVSAYQPRIPIYWIAK